ncbi:MAG: TrkH family potassium uptake protein [Oscillospiraceae bacterium]|nr:TrkH family potassium uptake protein [Oscillospiraceae bacterium]
MNYRMITYILGWILIFEAIFMAVPVLTAICFGESAVWWFLATAAVCVSIGMLLTKIKKPQNMKLYSREGFVIVSLSWIVLSVFGSLPFFLSGEIPSFIDALFETVSGFTTTGASILSDVEKLSKSMLMWRSFTHWVGGMGVLVFIMAFVHLSGAQNMHIMKAESPGPSVSKLVPRVKTTALLLYMIYFVLTLAEFILLLFGGMTPFEALNTAFATAGTGGFGIYNSSIGGFSVYNQVIVIVFMLLFSVNFNSYFFLIKGKLREALSSEVRVFFGIVTVSVLIIAFNIMESFSSFGRALLDSSFAVSSVISTSGFSTVDFNLWPELSRTILVLLMFVGACAGSTGGGMKVSRLMILFKNLGRELLVMVHPKQVKNIKLDGHSVDSETVRSVSVYIVAYLAVFVASLGIISFDNHDLITNFTAVVSAINNIGPGLEMVGPAANFGFFSIPSKIVLIFDMLAGRLELFPMLLLFTPAMWKK